MRKLTARQEAFCKEYAASGLIEQSAIRAGYSPKYARHSSPNILDLPHVQDRLRELTKEVESKRIASMIEIKEFWTTTLRDPEQEMKERIKASELLAKTGGAFTEKVDVNVTHNDGLLKDILNEIKSEI